jgi:hypothetical protein
MWPKLIGAMDIGMAGKDIIIIITILTTITITIIRSTINADGCLATGNMDIGTLHIKYAGSVIMIRNISAFCSRATVLQ